MMKSIIFAVLILVGNAYAEDTKPEEKSLSVSISESIFQIKQASTQYYLKSGFWPSNVDELKVGGFLPIDFPEKTSWGKKWKIDIVGEDLNISIDAPDVEELGDKAAESEVLDVASRALKAIDGSKKRFAQGDKSAQQTAAEDKNKGEQAFERGNIENRAIIKELTITSDKQYLDAAKQGIVLERLPNNYIRISSTLKSGVQIATDNKDISFNTKVNFNDGISARIFLDQDDANFYLDPSKESKLKQLTLSKIIDTDDTNFFLDPSEESAVKDLKVETIAVNALFVDRINGGTPVTVESLDQVAVTRMRAGSNISVSNGRGDARTVGFITIAVVDNPEFVSVNTTGDVGIGGNLTVGATLESITNNNFSLNGNDAFVAGDLGVNGNIYSDGSLIINSATNQLTLNGAFIQSSSNLLLRANGDAIRGLQLSSDGTDLSLTTTGNSALNIGSSGDQITFQTNANSTNGIRFQNSSASNILTIDTLNSRVGVNTATPTSALQVVGQLRATEILVNARAGDTPIQVTRPNSGQWLGFDSDNDGNDNFGVYNFDSTYDPNGATAGADFQQAADSANITANRGSIALDTAQGNLYIKTTNSSSTGWRVIPNASSVFLQGGNVFNATAVLGSNNAQNLVFETNNTVALTLDTSQNASFVGNITLNNSNISNVNNLQINTLSAQNNSLTFTLNENQANALRIQDSTTQYLNFDSAAKNISVGASLTLGSNLIVGDNFDINGGEIDGVSIGSNVPLTSLNVGSLTLSGNVIDTVGTNVISFGNNNLTTSGTLTVGNLNVSGSNLLDLGDLSLDSLSAASNTISINLNDTQANALSIQQGGNAYLTFDTDNNTIIASQNLVLGSNNISGSSFTITGGVIDNTVIGANTAASATFTSVAFETLGSAVNFNNQILSNVNIDSGSIDGVSIGANIPLDMLSVGSLTITGNTITSSTNVIAFGDNNLVTTGTLTLGSIDLSNSSINDFGSIELNSLSAFNNTLTFTLNNAQTQALDIRDDAGTSFLTFDTSNNQIILGQTLDFNNNTLLNIALTSGTIDNVVIGGSTPTLATFSNLSFGTLTSSVNLNNQALTNVNIDSGTLTGVAITANSLSIDDITINNNQITSSNASGIDFVGQTLTTSAAISAGSLDVSTISGVTNISLDNILANTGNTITIGVNNNAINIAGNALSINSGDISTTGSLTVGGTFITNSVDINGGSIDGVSIGTNTPLSTLGVGSFTITGNSITSSDNQIDFGGATLTTTGNLVIGGQDFGGEDVSNIDDISLNSISVNTGNNINIGTSTNTINLSAGALTIDTSNDISLGGNLTITSGILNASSVNISGGTLTGVAITANSLSIDDITINNNQITSSNASGIDFVGQTLTTTANISAGSLDVSTISGVTNISLDNILANTGNTITIGVNNNAINIAGNALSINSGDISTTGSLTVGGTFITNSVDINGGSIDGVSIGANTPLSTLGVGSFTITGNSITSSSNTINFGGATLTTTGNLVIGGQDFGGEDVSNIDDISLNSISVNTGNNINIGTSTNTINLSAGALTIDTSNDISLGGNLTITSGILNASSVNISGGTLTGVAITANSLNIDDITIAGNQITSSNASGIDFVGQTLTTTANISAGSLDVSTISGVTNISLDNILANTGNTITIGVNNNAINIAGNALSINSGDISTTGSLTVGGTFITNSVDINGGSIDGVSIGANTPLSTLGVGSFTITGNSITSSSNTINFGGATLTTTGNLVIGGQDFGGEDVSNIDDISLNSISVNTGNNINIGTSTNTINLSAGALTIDTSNDISLGGSLTITSGILNASSVNISGGTLTGVAITANSLSIDDITIAGNQITSSNASGIDFVGQTLTTTANISAGSLDVSTISGVTNISLDNILANTGNTITIGVNNNAINIAGNALSINSGDISTTGSLTVGGTFIANSVDINGGSIDGVSIGANIPLSTLGVGSFTITGNSITSSSNTINFGGATLTTTGNLVIGGQDFGGEDVSNIDDISLNSISVNTGNNINIGTSTNTINLSAGALTIDTSNDISLGGNLTITSGILNASSVNISGGTLTGVAITANSLNIDDITINNNQITSSNIAGISFANQTLTTSAAISAGSLDVSTISGVTNISLDNILANTGNTITIGVNNNAINIAGNALSINSGDISTTGSLTVGGTFITNSVDINGGSIDGVAIGVNDAVTRLTVDDIFIDGNSITNITGGNIDFGGATLTTTGSVIANGFNANDNNISNVGNIMLDSISADDTNIAINASGNVNIQSGSLIVTSSAVTINNTLDIDTANVDQITFSNGSSTGAIRFTGSEYAFVNTSDRRAKQDIQNTRLNASNILNSFRIVDYRYIAHPTSDLITGFIAQEAQAVYSPMVSNLSNDLLGVSTSSVIPILVKGFQEQQVDLSNLTTVIDINQNNINLNKDLNVHNQTVVDTDNNLYANSLKLNNDIHIDSNEFSIKRSSTMSDLMSISTAKIANKNAQGYLSVKDVYLADGDRWASNTSQFNVFTTEPNTNDCVNESDVGSIGILVNTEKLYICTGAKGWQVLEMKDI